MLTKYGESSVIVEDTTLHIEGMSLEDASNIKWMVDDLPDHVGKKAIERVSIGYADGVNVYAYVGRTNGKLVTRRGTKGFAHDFYFMPKGSTKTYAEEKKVSSRTKAIKKFVADKPDFVVEMPKDWTGAWQEDYTPEDMLTNPRIPKKYEGQDPSEHSDLYTDEDLKGTIQGLGFKDKATAEKSVNIIKRSGKTHAHKIQAAQAMEQRARFHPNATPGIKAATQKVYANFIEEMKKKTKRNPSKTPEGRKIPKRYLKGLNKEEMLIAAKEIDKGYKYDINDPKAYEYWKSDIKATARGYKTVPSKHKKKFIEMYGPLPEKGKFLDKIAKATKIKKSILQKVYDKGLAACGEADTDPVFNNTNGPLEEFTRSLRLATPSRKENKKMPDYKLAVEAGLVKENPRGEVYVQDLIDTDDMRKIMTMYKMRVRQMFSTKGSPVFLKRRKEELAKIRKEFNWRGRTAESLFEAVADQINKETKLKPVVKVYRGMIGLDLGQDNMLQHLQEYGAGPFWSTRKESADIYVGGKKYDYSGFFGAKITPSCRLRQTIRCILGWTHSRQD